MALVLALSVFTGLALVFGTLSWSRWLRWRFDERELARRVGRRPSRALRVERSPAERDLLGDRMPRVRRLLVRSGVAPRVGRLVAATAACAGIGVLLASRILPVPAAFAGVVLGGVPLLGLAAMARRRRDQVRAQLPGAIEGVVGALRSGRALPQALGLAGGATPAPLGPALCRVADRVALGIPLRVGLRDLEDELPPTVELRIAVGAVLLNEETGGDLVQGLGQVVDLLRERRVFAEKLRAATAEARASAAVLTALPVVSSLALVVGAPDYLDPLLAPGALRTAFVACLAWSGLGLGVMGRLASPEARWQP